MGLHNLEGSDTIGRLQHPVSQLAQNAAGVRPDVDVIFNSENRLAIATLGNSRYRCGGLGRFIRIQARQINFDRRALSNLAVNSYVTAGLLHEAIDLGQTQAGAVTDILRGEKGLESLGYGFPGHANAVVGDGQHDVLARDPLRLTDRIALIERYVRRLDRQLAAVRHGISRVHRQIDDRYFQLVRIDIGPPETGRHHRFNGDLLADRSMQQIRHAGHQTAEVDRLGGERLVSRKWPEPLG